MYYNDNGEIKPINVKASDTLPIGTEVYYDGDTVPTGWEQIEEIEITEATIESGATGSLTQNKYGRTVFATGSIKKSLIQNNWNKIATLTKIPISRFECVIINNDNDNAMHGRVQADGSIIVWGNISGNADLQVTLMYLTNE